MARGWYVIQVYTGYEKKVMTELLQKKNSDLLRDVVIDVKVPEEEYTVEKKGKKINKRKILYPGYVLAELDIPEDETKWKKIYTEIRSIAGVGMFLTSGGGNKKPYPLAYDDIKFIFEKSGEIKSTTTKLEPGYYIGEKVKITEGPFKDFEGEIQEVNTERNNIVVTVEIFGRLTPVELEFNQVQKI